MWRSRLSLKIKTVPALAKSRSAQAESWQHLYSSARWRRLRAAQLAAEPICRMCDERGAVTVATVCDHIEPHRGDLDKFWSGPFQSLCKPHHDSLKQREERQGYSEALGRDGWPLDPQHPANSGVLPKAWGFSIPHGVQPSGIPVMLVCGPPAGGKSTYVRAQAQPGDTVIDFDAIRRIVGGEKWDQREGVNARAWAYRDRVIRGLKDKRRGTAWLIVMAPTRAERMAWASALGDVTEVLVMPAREVCISRMQGDPDRLATASIQAHEIDKWFRNFDGPTQARPIVH